MPYDHAKEREQFREEAALRWTAAIREIVGSAPPTSARWTGIPSILAALAPLTNAHNQMFFPSRGGNELGYVESGSEPSSIILGVSGGSAHLGKPRSLTFELIEHDWAQSFFVLDLHPIEPSGVYYDEDDGDVEDEAVFADTPRLVEEVVEIMPGSYEPRAVWDRGFIGHDEYGREEPLPEGSRLLKRMLSGRVLIVSKGSHWNREKTTYDARHNRMSNDAIRAAVERLTGSASR